MKNNFRKITIEEIENQEYFKSFTKSEKEEHYTVSERLLSKRDSELAEIADAGNTAVERYAASELLLLRMEDKIW